MITDDDLQSMTAIQYMSCIRQIEINYSNTQQSVKQVPIILLTDKNDSQLMKSCQQLHVEHVLTKPLRDDEFNAVLKKLVEQETLNTVLLGQSGQQLKKSPELTRSQIATIVAVEGNAGGTAGRSFLIGNLNALFNSGLFAVSGHDPWVGEDLTAAFRLQRREFQVDDVVGAQYR